MQWVILLLFYGVSMNFFIWKGDLLVCTRCDRSLYIFKRSVVLEDFVFYKFPLPKEDFFPLTPAAAILLDQEMVECPNCNCKVLSYRHKKYQ